MLSIFAENSAFWYNFKRYWIDFIGQQSGVVLLAIGIGAVGIFVICSGNSKK